ncbi:MAG: hypothetical protein DYG98_14185 [Haliscomenobacteraceae bacterium CHB4]|nr:hypothetical protein [Haliscomenobacteraceae bacterium CHB4]
MTQIYFLNFGQIGIFFMGKGWIDDGTSSKTTPFPMQKEINPRFFGVLSAVETFGFRNGVHFKKI